ncbi:DUF3099 domain-containing protein [Enemella sp. A6]|uniref:DUF3099 domain-containing protein n=1 Tax=Enemella sp. A6 TaxID=3440152 RepID=UPI003EB7BCD4
MAKAIQRPTSTVITGARAPRSEDLARRQRNYLVLMAFRVACIVGMVFVPGIWRWVLLLGAAVLPALAVLIANNVDIRTPAPVPDEPQYKAIPAQHSDHVVPGEVIDDD